MSVLSQRISKTDAGHSMNDVPYAVAVKDSIDVAGYSTIAGSRALADSKPAEQDATVVKALLDAGCELVGKTHMHELAFGMTGVNEWAGTPLNHRFPDLIPGGSSSGSAVAVANSMADFSLGTDTGGSIRVPAACCGVYGFKPSFGRVDRQGIMPKETTLDCVGPFADSAELLIEAMRIIDPTFKAVNLSGLQSLKFGVVDVNADAAIWTCVNDYLTAAQINSVSVPLGGIEQAFNAGMSLICRETWQACGYLLDSGKLGADVAKRLAAACEVTDQEIEQAEKIRTSFTQEVDRLLEEVDLLVLPTLPSFPLELSEAKMGKTDLNISALVRPFNLSGHPALSIPLLATGHRPAGLQLVGRKGSDELLCEVARLFSVTVPKNKQK